MNSGNWYKTLSIVLGGVLILLLIYLAFNNSWLQKTISKESQPQGESLIEVASAKEIYPLFECPCCGKTIGECDCPMSKERRTYIDGLIEAKSSKEKIVSAYVKKYGLDSFVDKEKAQAFRQELVKAAPANRPIISITPQSYNLGEVSQKKGVVITFFELKNKGKSDLIIDKLETSCGCTSASIVFEEKEGPKFNMPGMGINEKIKDWQVVIPPGKIAQLKVYYDPNFHKDFRGLAIREISIFSNDPVDFEKKVRIELEQVD
jgi:hypothetical protein